LPPEASIGALESRPSPWDQVVRVRVRVRLRVRARVRVRVRVRV